MIKMHAFIAIIKYTLRIHRENTFIQLRSLVVQWHLHQSKLSSSESPLGCNISSLVHMYAKQVTSLNREHQRWVGPAQCFCNNLVKRTVEDFHKNCLNHVSDLKTPHQVLPPQSSHPLTPLPYPYYHLPLEDKQRYQNHSSREENLKVTKRQFTQG